MNYFESIYNQGLEKNAEHISKEDYAELKRNAYWGDRSSRITLKSLARNNPDLILRYEGPVGRKLAVGVLGSGTAIGSGIGRLLAGRRGFKASAVGAGVGGLSGLALGAYGAKKVLQRDKKRAKRVVEALKDYGSLGGVEKDNSFLGRIGTVQRAMTGGIR